MIRILLSLLIALMPWRAAAAGPLTFEDGRALFGWWHAQTHQQIVDHWTFSVASTARASGSVMSGAWSFHQFDLSSVEIVGDGFAQMFDAPASDNPRVWTLTDAVLPPGDYAVRITGIVVEPRWSGSYHGGLTVSPVPEPASLALAAAGLSVVVWIARRRQGAPRS
jgi:hypothetical protein